MWSERPAQLRFTIKPPFWETLWFRLLGLLAVSGALFGFHRARVAHLTLELENRRKEEALRKTEEDYKSLVENVNGIIYSLSDKGAYTFVSSQWKDLLGHDPGQVAGRHYAVFIHPDYHQRYYDFLTRMKQTGERKSVDYMIRHSDDAWRWHNSTGSAIKEDGALLKYVCVAIDISERKNAEEALRESEERFRTFMETASDFMHITDKEGRFVYVNDSMARSLAYSREEMIGMHISELELQKDHAGNYESKLDELVLKGKTSFDTAWITRQQKEIIGNEMLVAIYKGGEFLGARGVFHDLTEQREAEKRMIIAEKASRLASIGVMAAGITHEINQPLTTINFAATRLVSETRKQKSPLSKMVEDKLQKIMDAIRRIDEIVRHMRSFWIDPGQMVEETLELSGVVRSALSIINRQLLSHGIKIEVSLAEEPVRLSGNRVHLEQIVINLVVNSMHALDELGDSKEKTIQVKTILDPDHVVLEISDNGTGFQSDDEEKIFEPFYSTKSPDKGTGLGLAIVKRFVEEHSGTITVANNESGGATVTTRFPVYKPE